MTARRCTVLLLLAGVFALHGVQCTAGGTDAAAGHAAAAPAVHSGADALEVTAGVAAVEEQPLAPPAVAAAVAGAGYGSVPHDAAGHLWTVCVAVLAAGLAVLLAVLAPRLASVAARAVVHLRAAAGSLAQPRPPDLSALCLLRI